ncbi:hypothetical protein [Aphanizomenon flos-aquae]|uniref:hypothetical protein n=1 Tax=Aphanizomenon flos-aquae TaxID=1176 RepID=UPI00126991A8|nr:hypothetical protein [Aphanizomenon flos-aquae]
MNYNDLTEFSDLPYDITLFSEYDGICTLNGMIPIPVDAVSFSYESDEDIEIYNEHNNFLGVLCICKSITDINIASLTEARYIAYINEVDKGLPNKKNTQPPNAKISQTLIPLCPLRLCGSLIRIIYFLEVPKETFRLEIPYKFIKNYLEVV